MVISRAESGSVLEMRSTLDDLLACVATAERVIHVPIEEKEEK